MTMTAEPDGGWFKGPEVSPDGALYPELLKAFYGVHPVLRHNDQHACWVMNLDWYKRIRTEFGPSDDDDPSKWVPAPEDRLLGIPVTVTEDGGAPHIENRSYPADFGEITR